MIAILKQATFLIIIFSTQKLGRLELVIGKCHSHVLNLSTSTQKQGSITENLMSCMFIYNSSKTYLQIPKKDFPIF